MYLEGEHSHIYQALQGKTPGKGGMPIFPDNIYRLGTGLWNLHGSESAKLNGRSRSRFTAQAQIILAECLKQEEHVRCP